MKILLIEDDLMIADFVLKGLSQSGFITSHALDGLSGLDLALNSFFDLAILDLMLPKLDGLSLLKRIRSEEVNLPVIILSARHSVDERIEGLRQGGDDYLTKPFAFAELLARIEAILRRSAHPPAVDSSLLTFDELELDLLARTVSRAGKKIELQPKEFALLEFLIRNAGLVISKTMIMDRVWNYQFDPGTNVVEARICKLRDKIDKGFSYPLIRTIRGLGYVLSPPDSKK